MNVLLGNKYLTLAFRLLLGIVFIYAAFDKIIYPGDFSFAIRNYRILPPEMSNLLAIFLPWLELYCGIFLIIGLFSRASAMILSFFLVIFIVAIASAIFRGLDISCGCFKTVDQTSRVGISRILEDIGYLVAGIQIAFFGNPYLNIERLFKKENES